MCLYNSDAHCPTSASSPTEDRPVCRTSERDGSGHLRCRLWCRRNRLRSLHERHPGCPYENSPSRLSVGLENCVTMEPKPDSPSGQPRSDLDVTLRIAVTTDSPVYKFATAVLVIALAVVLLNAIRDPRGNLLAALIVGPIMLLALDYVAARAQNRWLRGTCAIASARGIEAPIRPQSDFVECEGKYELRSPILRRRLRGFVAPNMLTWSSNVLVRILPTSRKPFHAMAVLDFVGFASDNAGPRLLFRGTRFWVPLQDIHRFVEFGLKGGAHVRVLVTLHELA